eukprot:jgi/Psemu1/308045/fgenesh1_kg.375_\
MPLSGEPRPVESAEISMVYFHRRFFRVLCYNYLPVLVVGWFRLVLDTTVAFNSDSDSNTDSDTDSDSDSNSDTGITLFALVFALVFVFVLVFALVFFCFPEVANLHLRPLIKPW